MAGTESGEEDAYKVIYTYEDRFAPTGEGTILVTANGERWRRCLFTPVISGRVYGYFSAGRIFPEGG